MYKSVFFLPIFSMMGPAKMQPAKQPKLKIPAEKDKKKLIVFEIEF